MTSPATTTEGDLLLVPGDRFFLQSVTLDASSTPATQVELALEAASPFPLAQMYHGFLTNAERTQALAFAAYRKRFTPEELAEWGAAGAVLPSFLALCGPAPKRPQIVVHTQPGLVQAAAWNGTSTLPVAVRAMALPEPGDAEVAEVVAELRAAAGLGEVEVRRLTGPIGAGRDDEGDAIFRVDGRETTRIPAAHLGEPDVRDKSFLEERLQAQQGDRRWWAAAVTATALVLLALILEVSGLGISLWGRKQRAEVAARADEVQRIESARVMAGRIEQLSARQQRPLEWLAQASAVRPRSVQFTRAISRSERTLEIEAQTANAADAGNYESALRQLAGLASAEMRVLQSRDGVTSFAVVLTFREASQ